MKRVGIAMVVLVAIVSGSVGQTTQTAAAPRSIFRRVTASRLGSCGLLTNGSVECWGDNEFGELGNGSTSPSQVPVRVGGLTNAVSVSAAPCTHVHCWRTGR
jgi:Regulator of chromosome condensation (RCC1) repeat